MVFDGPAAADYENVASLNRAYLSVLRQDSRAHHGLAHLSAGLYGRITELTEKQVDYLAQAPFLLLSFREHDDRYWERTFGDRRDRDLFASSGSEDLDMVVSAGLGFVWQLARQNPYALRLFCGASIYWCERICEQTFFALLSAVMAHGRVAELRHAYDHELWGKLLDQGINARAAIRRASHMSALQTVLTRPANQRRHVLARAASSSGRHALTLADDAGSGK
jgi:hypothetical protein